MKTILKLAFLFALAGFSVPSHAYDNEPDGFRGILWGASPSSIEGMEGSSDAASVLSQYGMSLGDIPLTSYSRKEDKLEFNGVEIEKIVYFFYNDKFFFAQLFYEDSNYTPVGIGYGQKHTLGAAPPRYYEAKSKVDQTLKKYFGTPTDSPNFFQVIARKVSKVVYLGSVTKILSNCDDSGIRCRLAFTSVKLNTEFENDLNSKVQQSRSETQRKESDIKAKPDY